MKNSPGLFNKNFFLLWQGQLVSQVGNQAFAIAMAYWIKHQTGSASLMGLVMMASTLPAVILGPIGGTFADLHSRKKIIVFCDLMNGIAVLSLAGLVYYDPLAVELILPWLFCVSVFVATVNAFFRPAVSASIPDIVPEEKVAAANSMNESSVQVSTFLGQGAGGVLFRYLGASKLFFIDGFTYIFSAFSEMFINIPQEIPERTGGMKDMFHLFVNDTKTGFKYVWKRTGMRNLFLIAAVLNFFIFPIIVLLPFFVEDFLLSTPDWYGYILASFGFASIIGYSIAGTVQVSGKTRSLLVPFLIVLNSAGMAMLGLVKSPYIAVGLMFINGVMNGFININIMTILQVSTPADLRGRVFGLLFTMSQGITPIAMGLGGIVADLVNQNIPLIYVVCGSIAAALSFIVCLNKATRDFLAYEPGTENTPA